MPKFFVSFQDDPKLMEFRDPAAPGHVSVHTSKVEQAIDEFVVDNEDMLCEVAAEVEHHDSDRDYLTLYVIEHDAQPDGSGGVTGGPIEYRIKFERSYTLTVTGPVKEEKQS